MAVRSFVRALIDAQVPSMFSTDAPHISFPVTLNNDEYLYLSQQIETIGGRNKWILVSALNSGGQAIGRVIKSDGNNGFVWGNEIYRRTATKVIAATDSIDKSNADYVCDGTADEVQINAAITALVSVGGRVQLLEGTYTIENSIELRGSVTLEGQGAGTVITLPDSWSGAIDMIDTVGGADMTNVIIRDLKIYGKSKGGGEINGIAALTFNMIVQRVIFAYLTNGYCVHSRSSYRMKIIGNIFENNYGSTGVYDSSGSQNIITKNSFYKTNTAIELDGASIVFVEGNQINDCNEDALVVDSCIYCTVIGNTINYVTKDGIELDDCESCTVIGNHITQGGQGTDDTYAGIRVTNDSNDCNVQGNTVRHGGGAKQFKYGIDVDNANCDDNFVSNNDLNDSGKTGSLNDSGTGTITVAGNRL